MQDVQYETQYRNELHHFWYRVRLEMVRDILNNYFKNRTDLTLADIGCGTGAITKALERYGKCMGIDSSAQGVEFCKSRGVRDVRLGTAEATGCEASTFDVVTCLDVLEHLPDDTEGIAEIHRILKPGGMAIIFVPTFMFLWGINDELGNHYRRYRLPELAGKFPSEQFTLLRSSYFNTLLFPLVALVRITARLCKIKMGSEVETSTGASNALFYQIFSFERRLLRYMNFPFGVSGMLILQKK